MIIKKVFLIYLTLFHIQISHSYVWESDYIIPAGAAILVAYYHEIDHDAFAKEVSKKSANDQIFNLCSYGYDKYRKHYLTSTRLERFIGNLKSVKKHTSIGAAIVIKKAIAMASTFVITYIIKKSLKKLYK